MEIKTRVRKWGNSFGLVIPKSIADAGKIKKNEDIIIEIKTRPLAAEFFGRFPRKSEKTAQEIKDETRRGWG